MSKKFHENFAKQNNKSVNVKIVFMNNIKLFLIRSYENKEICAYIRFLFKKTIFIKNLYRNAICIKNVSWFYSFLKFLSV